jgi:hypothetical protein
VLLFGTRLRGKIGMTDQSPGEEEFLTRWVVWLRHAKGLLLVPLLLTVVIAGIYWRWQVLRQTAPTSTHYGITPADIEVVPRSDWIDRHDLLRKVVRDASLDDRLSLLDADLTERISLALRDHPWVKRVKRVEKFHPPRIKVTIEYRKPVAMVVRPDGAGPSDEFVVDSNGIRLPVTDYVVDRKPLEYLAQIRNVPMNVPPIGKQWEDGRVVGAAEIASAIGPFWKDFSLLAIEPSAQPVPGSTHTYTFDLVTRGGQKIPWGRQPVGEAIDSDVAPEPTADSKVQKLKNYVEKHGVDLDGTPTDLGFERRTIPNDETVSPRERDRSTDRPE